MLWRLHHDLNRFRRKTGGADYVANRRLVLRCAGVVHCLRIRLHVDPARTTETEHPWNHRRRRLGGGDAVVGSGEAAGCWRDRKRGHERRFQTSRFLGSARFVCACRSSVASGRGTRQAWGVPRYAVLQDRVSRGASIGHSDHTLSIFSVTIWRFDVKVLKTNEMANESSTLQIGGLGS